MTATPLQHHDMCYEWAEWADVMALRFGLPLRNMPVRCGCGKAFSEAHALQCNLGGFVIARHDAIRDFFLSVAKYIFNRGVDKEPKFESLSEDAKKELAELYNCTIKENPRGDISIVGLLRRGERCFIDFRVWNHLATRYSGQTVSQVHAAHTQEKNTTYKPRADIENGSFLAAVFNTAGSASGG